MSKTISLKTIRTIVLVLIWISLGGGIGYYFGNQTLSVEAQKGKPQVLVNTTIPEEYQEVDFSLFWEVWQKVEKQYLDTEKIDREEMVYGAIKGMVSALDDPYTVFLPPEQQKRSTEDLSGAFEGVGIQLGFRDSNLAVIAPLKGMPAEAAGVQAGDYILRIKDDGKGIDIDTVGISLPEAVSYIRGEHNKPVTLTLFRDDGTVTQPFEVTISRDTIVIPSVEVEFSDNPNGDGELAILSLSRFGGRTEDEWDEAVDEIVARDVEGVVLDLRNNPGGYVTAAVFAASEFIDSGVVVQQQGKYDSETYNVNRRGKLIDMPVSVLINRGSASASEILAGALRDRKDAPLVGTRSFGKGTVQTAEDLRDGTGIHITIARWLLPSGDWIHEDGLEPDIEATNSAETVDVDEMLEAAKEAVGEGREE